MSLRLALLSRWLRLTERRMLARARDPAPLRRRFERQARLLPAPRGARRETVSVAGRPALRVTGAGTGAKDGAGLLLHFHGGAYVFGSPRTHWKMLARLSAATGCPALLPDYRLAPEHPFPAAFTDALAIWEEICTRFDPGRVVIGGDSAGGGLALALLAEILRRDLPRPAGTYAMSPFTDMTLSGASLRENASRDALLPASRMADLRDLVLAGADPADWRASPLEAAFTGAGPVWLSCSETEILRDDTLRLASRLWGQGIRTTLHVAKDVPHAWPIFGGILPEADAALADLAEWVAALR